MSKTWNDFVRHSKNGTFLLEREYMDYHSDRFADYSLMIYRRGKLYALLPGNVSDVTFYSHQGLTYGGLVMNEKATAADVVRLFGLLNALLKKEGLERVVYKPTPWIYHRLPSEEDLYAIVEFCEAKLTRGLSSVISRESAIPWYRIRTCGAKRAQQMGLVVEESEDYGSFWSILSHNLRERYGLIPVHTVPEIELLHSRFPEHIRLFVVREGQQIIGGTVLYVTDRVVHAQYIAASGRGKEVHALDLLFQDIVNQSLQTHAYFDFGISTEKKGTYLNRQLIYQKEGFGGRGVCYDWYEWTL